MVNGLYLYSAFLIWRLLKGLWQLKSAFTLSCAFKCYIHTPMAQHWGRGFFVCFLGWGVCYIFCLQVVHSGISLAYWDITPSASLTSWQLDQSDNMKISIISQALHQHVSVRCQCGLRQKIMFVFFWHSSSTTDVCCSFVLTDNSSWQLFQ